MADHLTAQYAADDLPVKIMTHYVKNMKDFHDRKTKDKLSKHFLAMLKRPPSIWPVIRLLFPSVRTSFCVLTSDLFWLLCAFVMGLHAVQQMFMCAERYEAVRDETDEPCEGVKQSVFCPH